MGGSWHDRCLTVWAPNDCGDSALARSPSSRSPKKPPIASPRMSPGRWAQPCGTPGVTRGISPTTTTSTSGHSIAGDSPKCWANPTATTTSLRYDRRGVDLTNTQPTLDPLPRFRSWHPQARLRGCCRRPAWPSVYRIWVWLHSNNTTTASTSSVGGRVHSTRATADLQPRRT
jgi:hypothetical protein